MDTTAKVNTQGGARQTNWTAKSGLTSLRYYFSEKGFRRCDSSERHGARRGSLHTTLWPDLTVRALRRPRLPLRRRRDGACWPKRIRAPVLAPRSSFACKRSATRSCGAPAGLPYRSKSRSHAGMPKTESRRPAALVPAPRNPACPPARAPVHRAKSLPVERPRPGRAAARAGGS